MTPEKTNAVFLLNLQYAGYPKRLNPRFLGILCYSWTLTCLNYTRCPIKSVWDYKQRKQHYFWDTLYLTYMCKPRSCWHMSWTVWLWSLSQRMRQRISSSSCSCLSLGVCCCWCDGTGGHATGEGFTSPGLNRAPPIYKIYTLNIEFKERK